MNQRIAPALSQEYLTYSVEERSQSTSLDVQLRQLTRGEFVGTNVACNLDNMLLYKDHWSQSLLANGVVPDDYILLGAPVGYSHPLEWCGVTMGKHHVALAKPGCEIDFKIAANGKHMAMVLPIALLRDRLGSETTERLLKSGRELLSAPDWLTHRFFYKLLYLIDFYQKPSHATDPDPTQANWEAELVDDLGEIIWHDSKAKTDSPRTNRKIVRCAVKAAENVKEPINIPRFSEIVGVNQRSLEQAFKQQLGVTPKQYITLRRLHGVYAELFQRPADSRCVTEVANAWGFTELGRFSGEYRKLFGELPSQTLQGRSNSRMPRLLENLVASA